MLYLALFFAITTMFFAIMFFRILFSKQAEIEEINEAWTQGQDEMVQGFEQEYLTWKDEKESYENQIEARRQDLADSERIRAFLKDELVTTREAALGMQIRLREHDEKCLPNLELLQG